MAQIQHKISTNTQNQILYKDKTNQTLENEKTNKGKQQ